MKNRPEMQMSHCADEHESASSGVLHKDTKTSLDSSEVLENEFMDTFQRKAVCV